MSSSHLKCELVLFRVTESPHLVDDVLEVVLNEVHGLAEPAEAMLVSL